MNHLKPDFNDRIAFSQDLVERNQQQGAKDMAAMHQKLKKARAQTPSSRPKKDTLPST